MKRNAICSIIVSLLIFTLPAWSQPENAPPKTNLDAAIFALVAEWQTAIRQKDSERFLTFYQLPTQVEVATFTKGKKREIIKQSILRPDSTVLSAWMLENTLMGFDDVDLNPALVLTNPANPECHFKSKKLTYIEEARQLFDYEVRSLTFARIDDQWKIMADQRIYFADVPEYADKNLEAKKKTVQGFLELWKKILREKSGGQYINLFDQTFGDIESIGETLDEMRDEFYQDIHLDTPFRRDFYDDQIGFTTTDEQAGTITRRLSRLSGQWQIIDEQISLVPYPEIVDADQPESQIADTIRQFLNTWHYLDGVRLQTYYAPEITLTAGEQPYSLAEYVQKVDQATSHKPEIFVHDLEISPNRGQPSYTAQIKIQTNLHPQTKFDLARSIFEKWTLQFTNIAGQWKIDRHDIVDANFKAADDPHQVTLGDLNNFLLAWEKSAIPYHDTAHDQLCASFYRYTTKYAANRDFYRNTSFHITDYPDTKYLEIRGLMVQTADESVVEKRLLLKYKDFVWWLISDETVKK